MNETISQGAKAIAVSLISPGGRIKFARVIRKHLVWFDLVAEVGLTWRQIADVLASAGAQGEDGSPFSIGLLSATVWRARQTAAKDLKRKLPLEIPSPLITTPHIVDHLRRRNSPVVVEQPEPSSPTESTVGSIPKRASKQPSQDLDRDELRRRMTQAVEARRQPRP